MFYLNKEKGKTLVLKVAVHQDGLSALSSYGLTLKQINTIKTTSCTLAHWYYINDLATLKKINIDQLFSEDNKPKTQLDVAFGGLSNADIIAGKKKGDQPTTIIKDPFADTPSSSITVNQLKETWKEDLGVT